MKISNFANLAHNKKMNKINFAGKQRLQKWTRGCLAIVNSAGFIRYWAPLFKSEGPSQVAVIVLTFLLKILGPIVPFDEWETLGKLHVDV